MVDNQNVNGQGKTDPRAKQTYRSNLGRTASAGGGAVGHDGGIGAYDQLGFKDFADGTSTTNSAPLKMPMLEISLMVEMHGCFGSRKDTTFGTQAKTAESIARYEV